MHSSDTTPPTGDPSGHPATTGDDGVDAALSRLTDLDALPVREHIAVFEAVHGALQDRLADTEQGA